MDLLFSVSAIAPGPLCLKGAMVLLTSGTMVTMFVLTSHEQSQHHKESYPPQAQVSLALVDPAHRERHLHPFCGHYHGRVVHHWPHTYHSSLWWCPVSSSLLLFLAWPGGHAAILCEAPDMNMSVGFLPQI